MYNVAIMKLTAEKREIKSPRGTNEVFGILYGHKIENIPLKVSLADFQKVYDEAGASTIFTLSVDGQDFDVLIKDTQIDPKSDRFIHADFYAVTKGEEIETDVPVEITGESEAVKKGGVLNVALSELKVKSLPKNLPHSISVDISELKDSDSLIRVSDLFLPEGVEVLDDPELTVVSIVEAKSAEEEELENQAEPNLEQEGNSETQE